VVRPSPTLITILSTGFSLVRCHGWLCFAKRKFPGSNFLFWVLLAALMIPGHALVPLYLMISDFKLINTITGVMLPGLADVIGIFLLKQYMQTLPSELVEAARGDGATEWAIFAKIVAPLSAPALAVTAIFAFQRYWNSFLWPLIVLQDPNKFTLQVGLSYIHTSEFGTITACSCGGGPCRSPHDYLLLCLPEILHAGAAHWSDQRITGWCYDG
jgi:multiple sugar transport system permease protein